MTNGIWKPKTDSALVELQQPPWPGYSHPLACPLLPRAIREVEKLGDLSPDRHPEDKQQSHVSGLWYWQSIHWNNSIGNIRFWNLTQRSPQGKLVPREHTKFAWSLRMPYKLLNQIKSLRILFQFASEIQNRDRKKTTKPTQTKSKWK